MSALGKLVTRAYDLVVIGAGSGGLEVCMVTLQVTVPLIVHTSHFLYAAL